MSVSREPLGTAYVIMIRHTYTKPYTNMNIIQPTDSDYAQLSFNAEKSFSDKPSTRKWIRERLEELIEAHLEIAVNDGNVSSGQLVVKALDSLTKLTGVNEPERQALELSYQAPLFEFYDVPSADSMNDND